MKRKRMGIYSALGVLGLMLIGTAWADPPPPSAKAAADAAYMALLKKIPTKCNAATVGQACIADLMFSNLMPFADGVKKIATLVDRIYTLKSDGDISVGTAPKDQYAGSSQALLVAASPKGCEWYGDVTLQSRLYYVQASTQKAVNCATSVSFLWLPVGNVLNCWSTSGFKGIIPASLYSSGDKMVLSSVCLKATEFVPSGTTEGVMVAGPEGIPAIQ